MKRYLPVVLSVLLVIALAVPAAAGPFADVPENHWAYEAVKQLAAYGLVIGFPDGEYKGNEPMTRYQ
ncbi:MAG TPA: S-layer homology domain-containing protein, partial [Bacillota bacterium]|nr:S-layer homology domain-containing protein [Bacillota bacterium]